MSFADFLFCFSLGMLAGFFYHKWDSNLPAPSAEYRVILKDRLQQIRELRKQHHDSCMSRAHIVFYQYNDSRRQWKKLCKEENKIVRELQRVSL